MPAAEEVLNQILDDIKVRVLFGEKAVEDFAGYKREQQERIIALIISRARKGPRIKPHGIGDPLHDVLHGFTKIKPKAMPLRIIYRPTSLRDYTIMEHIAIGPRDREKVYRLAAKRLAEFQSEMARRRTGIVEEFGDGEHA